LVILVAQASCLPALNYYPLNIKDNPWTLKRRASSTIKKTTLAARAKIKLITDFIALPPL